MLKSSGVRFNNHGDIEISLVIPSRYRDQIVPLGLAMRSPLMVYMERWAPDTEEDEDATGDG